VKLYEKLKSENLVDDYKEFSHLIWIRAIRVNDYPVDDPTHELKENDQIKVGIKSIGD
jgi:ribosomal protein S4